jgi:Sporulation related domain.
MKDVMKKRVVGAVVLVIIGIALPLMLARCMQDDDGDAESMRVYEIAPDGQARPAGAPADGGKSNVERDSLDGSSGVADPDADEPDTPDMPEAVSPAASDEDESGASPQPRQSTAEPEPEPAGDAASAAGDEEQASSELRQRESFDGGYVVQVASFGDEANAERLARELGGEFKAFYRAGDVNGKTYYRVRVGPFESQANANSAAAQLRSSGRATLVRRAE